MSEKWQTEKAQLSLDLMEARVVKAELADKLRDVSAKLSQALTRHQEELRSCNDSIKSLQEKLSASEAELYSANSKIEQLYSEIADCNTALRHRSETEQTLRELLQSKENELNLKIESSEQYTCTLQREISQLTEENRSLRSSLMSEQRAGSTMRGELEVAQGQVISLHSQVAKAKAEIGVLKSNWQTERSRVLQLENSQIGSLIRDRDAIQRRLKELEGKVSLSESVNQNLSKKDQKIASLSKEIQVLNAALDAKDNIISELDSQLSLLQNQFHESSEHVQGQNKLIEDLYRRLKDSEICHEQYPIVL